MDEQILEVARSIRPHLPRLIGAEADECDRRLVELLRQAAAGADVGQAILELLTRQPATYSWAAAALADERHRPPDVQRASRGPVTRGYSPLPNPHGADLVDAERYACPVDGNFVWWRISVGDPVPTCRDHPDITLVPA